ncbi:white-brown complex-like protein [Actinidia rufa]|uniref:White-brown complex-like protein n=1 Tax=Actinidia rufa TaxID=165716 RepID=A0A7J0D892_9ERIC|nr:white-brown complex-like protein [Actinidia rufa]
MDFPVPRWTPSPSPTRTHLPNSINEQSNFHNDPDGESFVSEELDDLPVHNSPKSDFPFGFGSASPLNAIPNPNPPKTLLANPTEKERNFRNDTDEQSFVSEEDVLSFHNTTKSNFPFSAGPSSPRNAISSPSRPNILLASPIGMGRTTFLNESFASEEDSLAFHNNTKSDFPFRPSPTSPNNTIPSSGPQKPLLASPIRMERNAFLNDPDEESFVSEEYENLPFHNNTKSNFPFSNGPTSPSISLPSPPSQPLHWEPPSFKHLSVDQHHVIRLNNGCGDVAVKKGVFMTWKDLWVTVPDKIKGGRRAILEGLTGYVEPGKVLAIMGPSGCGKSTLLDALAGRLGSNTRRTGEILINGQKQALAFGTSAYVTQDDTLMTTLTVKEAVYYSAQLQLPDTMSRSKKKETAEATIRDMGLEDAMDTRIGGWSSKGLSGGQKRRVSICIEILTRPKLLFLDEPTSGLDSAASYHVMNRIIKLAQQDRRTVVASIHQPSGEVFELFHNLCLLSTGKTVYFGSTSAANEFFALNGFPCPLMRNPSDHYLRTVNKDFDVDLEEGLGRKTSTVEAINMLVKSYKSSEAYQQVQQRVNEMYKQKGETLEKKASQAGFVTQCLVLTRRSSVNMYRDLGYYWLRLAIYIALCLCVGTIFYDIGLSYGSIQARGSMLMFVAAFLTFMAIGGFPSFVEDMKIFTRERLNGHYGVSAFVVGNTFSSLPYLILISVIPGAIAYYLVGLQKGINHFAYFVLLLFACMLLVESLMMIVASVVPNFLMGIITGAGIQGVMMLNGGFFRLPNDLPKPFWRYPMYYIAFHKYANQGFFKNEFEGLNFPNNQIGGPVSISGDEILRSTWQVEMGYSKWVDLAILLGMVVLYRLMFLGIIKTVEKVKPILASLMAATSKQSTHVEDPDLSQPTN